MHDAEVAALLRHGNCFSPEELRDQTRCRLIWKVTAPSLENLVLPDLLGPALYPFCPLSTQPREATSFAQWHHPKYRRCLTAEWWLT